jgi:hypothetical protein
MQAFRFETRIDQNGVIHLPLNQQLFNRDVEIIVLPKDDLIPKKNASVDFINKWAGFLSNSNIEDAKFNYLSDKYK